MIQSLADFDNREFAGLEYKGSAGIGRLAPAWYVIDPAMISPFADHVRMQIQYHDSDESVEMLDVPNPWAHQPIANWKADPVSVVKTIGPLTLSIWVEFESIATDHTSDPGGHKIVDHRIHISTEVHGGEPDDWTPAATFVLQNPKPGESNAQIYDNGAWRPQNFEDYCHIDSPILLPAGLSSRLYGEVINIDQDERNPHRWRTSMRMNPLWSKVPVYRAIIPLLRRSPDQVVLVPVFFTPPRAMCFIEH